MKDESINAILHFRSFNSVCRSNSKTLFKRKKKKKKKKERREKFDKIFDLIAAWTKSWGEGKCGNRRLVGRGKYGDDIVNEAANKKPPEKPTRSALRFSTPRVNRTRYTASLRMKLCVYNLCAYKSVTVRRAVVHPVGKRPSNASATCLSYA